MFLCTLNIFRHVLVEWGFENPTKKKKKKVKFESLQGDTHIHTLTGTHTAHRVLRPAKSVLALAHLAAGDRGAVVDCFLVQLVLVHLQLQELPALQQRVILVMLMLVNELDLS